MQKNPSVSIVTGTYNSNLIIFKRVLDALKSQTYTARIIEHIIMDGGSTNGCIDIARKYGCHVFVRPDLMEKEQDRFSLGLKKAKGDLVLILESDNIPVGEDWLERLVEPIVRERVFCSYPMHNSYRQDMSLLTKYTALIGSPDPTLYYLHKSDKEPMTNDIYTKGMLIRKSSRYSIIRLKPNTMPTLGDNGILIKRKVLQDILRLRKSYIHVDAFHDIVSGGNNIVAVVHNSIVHVMGASILSHIKRRVGIKQVFTDERSAERTYHVMDWSSARDRCNLFQYIVFSVTFFQPLLVSIRGYLAIPEMAWFLHPFICVCMVFAYSRSEIVYRFKRLTLRKHD